MDEYAPPGMLINSRQEVVRFTGSVGSYLAAPGDSANLEILGIVQPHVREPLRTAIESARSTGMVGRASFTEAGEQVEIIVRAVAEPRWESHSLVVFERQVHRLRRLALERPEASGRSAEDLALDLAATRAYMQRLVEELRSANEEAQSGNEELQSTNEELQTAKEELQSSNEELVTTNEEMQGRNDELHRVNADLLNLLSSLKIPIVMLDRNLRICRYTPVAEKLFRMIPTDVGRPISDLNASIDIPEVVPALQQVIATGEAAERDVQDQSGYWYSLRLQPHRGSDSRIDGVVLQLLDIHELKGNIASLARAKEYADAIVAAVGESLIVLDEELRIRSVNKAFCETFGCEPEEPLQQSIHEWEGGRWNGVIEDLIAKVRAGDSAPEGEVEDTQRLHGPRTFLISARRVSASLDNHFILLALEDISDQKRAAEAKYRRIFESAKDGMLILSAEDGVVTDANPCALKLLGRERGQVVGQPFWNAVQLREGADEGRRLLGDLNRLDIVRLPEVELIQDGRRRLVEIVGNRYKEERRQVIQLNLRDITQRREFEQRLQQTAKLESLGILAGGIAHDFNNLLTGIMGNASLALLESNASSRYHRALGDVVKSSQRAAELTSQMLAYAGKGRYVIGPQDISQMVRDIGALVRTSLPKFVRVEMELAPGLPAVDADASQLHQVMMNLVINAAEAMEDAGGVVGVRTSFEHFDPAETSTRVVAEGLQPGRFVSLEVTDTGGGMDEATLDRIFDPFFTTKFTGRGLGLAAVQGIVRGHGGALAVQSRPGAGSTFRVYLPPSGRVAEAEPEVPKAASLRGTGTVLIVDDERDLVTMASTVLQFHGYSVLFAENGEMAVRIVRERGESLKAVLLDMNMPVMNGDKAAEEMFRLRPELPVILSTGYDSEAAGERLETGNIAGVLQKPYTAEKLLQALRKAAER